MSTPVCTGIAPHFVVADVVATAEFYRDKLGFELLGYFLDPPVYAMVRRDRAEIHFGKADSDRIQRNESVRKGMGTDAYIFVTDVNALYEEFLSRRGNNRRASKTYLRLYGDHRKRL